MALETELKYFEAHRAAWVQHHEGKFALIKGEHLQGVYDTDAAAFEAGVDAWGNVSFLIKEIRGEDRVEQTPALVYGLLHART